MSDLEVLVSAVIDQLNNPSSQETDLFCLERLFRAQIEKLKISGIALGLLIVVNAFIHEDIIKSAEKTSEHPKAEIQSSICLRPCLSEFRPRWI